MTRWWIGNVVLLVVVLPTVLVLLNRLLAAVERIRFAVDEVLADGVDLAGMLEPVPDLLATTDRTVKQVAVGATRYAGSAGRLLG